MKEGVRKLSVTPAWLGKGHKRLRDSHESALGPFSWCVRAGIRGMRYVSAADAGMKTGNAERLQALSTLEIAPAERWERRKRDICAAKCALLKDFLPAVCVSPHLRQLQECSLLGVKGGAGLGLLWVGQMRNTAAAMTPLVHRQVRKGQKAPPSHSIQEPGDILSWRCGEMLLELTVTHPSPPAFPKGRAHLVLFLLWMVFQSPLEPAMVMVWSQAVICAHLEKQHATKDIQDLQQ